MAVQTTYTETLRPGIAGQIADMTDKTLISRSVADAAGIGFGKVVQVGAADNDCTADLDTTDLTAQRFLGITVRDRSVADGANKYAQYESARIMQKGAVWVDVAVAVAPTDIVTVTLATGVIGKTAVGAGVVAVPNAQWESSTGGAGVAKLRLK